MGKSTAMKFIQAQLKKMDVDFIVTREPGGTPIAEEIRQVLLQHHEEPMTADTEALLMFASRAQNVATVIKPALAAGKWVLCDRFTDASIAYQGGGRQLGLERMQQLAHWVLGDFKPDLTILLDAPVEVGMQRISRRASKDRIEEEQLEFFERVRKTYLELANAESDRYCIVDASQNLKSVQAELQAILQGLCVS